MDVNSRELYTPEYSNAGVFETKDPALAYNESRASAKPLGAKVWPRATPLIREMDLVTGDVPYCGPRC